MLTLKIPYSLRNYTNNESCFITDEGTVYEVLNTFIRKYPEIVGILFNNKGEINSYIRIYVDNQEVSDLSQNQKLSANSVINLVTAIAGG